jgi:hypothetical protein
MISARHGVIHMLEQKSQNFDKYSESTVKGKRYYRIGMIGPSGR